jgi:regulator of sirC expression with transglutaminase-like and TPR domain
MAGSLQFEVPTPLQYFAALVSDDTSLPVLEAAVAVAQDEQPGLDVQGVLAEVDNLGLRLKRRVPADAAPMQRLRLLNHYFFSELGFAGNVNDYYDAANSSLPEVLATRRGIPITLALLYIELASQLGLRASGVSFPGHFLVKLQLPVGEVVIDPFSGQSLSRDELDERLQPYLRQSGLMQTLRSEGQGEFEAPLALFLQAASPRETLSRLLRNLLEVHRSAADLPRQLAALHRLVILLPEAWDLRRDRALVHAEMGQLDAAGADLAVYLEQLPGADDAAHLHQQLALWNARGDASGAGRH